MPSIHSEEIAKEQGMYLWHEVMVNKYFLSYCQKAKRSVGKRRRDWTGTDYGQWAQAFWQKLPDSPVIRKWPFQLVCDLAEWYCFGDEAGQDHESHEEQKHD